MYSQEFYNNLYCQSLKTIKAIEKLRIKIDGYDKTQWEKCNLCKKIRDIREFSDSTCKICLYDALSKMVNFTNETESVKICNNCGSKYISSNVKSICVCQLCLDSANPYTSKKLSTLTEEEQHCKTCKKNLNKKDFYKFCKMCISCTEIDKEKKLYKN